MLEDQKPARVLVTGAAGQVGRKVVHALACAPWCESVIGVDRGGDASLYTPEAQLRLKLACADLTRTPEAWSGLFEGVDAVVHLAAVQPTPDATWEQALASYEMTLNVLTAAVAHGVPRVVFASSNHVMGGYKDSPLADQMGPGKLTADLPPAPGTRWHNGLETVYSLAYATSKLMGERLCAAMATAAAGRLTTVSLRIGWVLPDENHPRDINHAGVAGPAPAAASDEPSLRALRWFRNMWLSNGDLERLACCAVRADAAHWPGPSVIVNGVSDNSASDWDLAGARRLIGYEPQDDAYRELARS